MKCPRCKGTGSIEYPSFVEPKRMIPGTCPVCRGRKSIRMNDEDLAELLVRVRDHLSDTHNCGVCLSLYNEISEKLG